MYKRLNLLLCEIKIIRGEPKKSGLRRRLWDSHPHLGLYDYQHLLSPSHPGKRKRIRGIKGTNRIYRNMYREFIKSLATSKDKIKMSRGKRSSKNIRDSIKKHIFIPKDKKD